MPEIRIAGRVLPVARGTNLLDALQTAGVRVASSCRAGHCQTCLVRSDSTQVPAAAREGLSPAQRQAGWLLSCQCEVEDDLELQLLDPARDGTPAVVHSLDWLNASLVRLRLVPQAPIRFAPAQHVTLWLDDQLARPYSIASLATDPWLEFHVRVHPHGVFSRAISQVEAGQLIHLSSVAGTLHFDVQWLDSPLLLLGQGTGLAPLQAAARDALNNGHDRGIALWHWHSDADNGCYLADALLELQHANPALTLHLRPGSQLSRDLTTLRVASRRTVALVAGHPAFVAQTRRPLFMAGLPGRQIIDEAFATGKA